MADTATQWVEDDLFGAAPEPCVRRSPGDLGKRMRDLAKPDMVRVAPDRHAWVPAGNVPEPPGYVFCRWCKTAQGNYAPIPVAGRWVRLSEDLVAGMGFIDGRKRRRYETLKRLGRAGFIDIVHLSPGCWMLDLDSWFRHLAECADNAEMWDEGSEDRESYLHANGLGGWKRHAGHGNHGSDKE